MAGGCWRVPAVLRGVLGAGFFSGALIFLSLAMSFSSSALGSSGASSSDTSTASSRSGFSALPTFGTANPAALMNGSGCDCWLSLHVGEQERNHARGTYSLVRVDLIAAATYNFPSS